MALKDTNAGECIFARQALIKQLYLLMTRVSDVRSDLGNDEAGEGVRERGRPVKGNPQGNSAPPEPFLTS